MTIIINADYFGGAINSARNRGKIPSTKMAHLFGVGVQKLHRYENGLDLIPRETLRRVFILAAMMDTMLGNNE